MKLTDLLLPASVLCNVEASSKKHVLEVVSKLITRDREALIEHEVFSSLIERERLGCTALASGLAIPHARVRGLTEPSAGLVKLSQPIEFDKSDDTDVDIVFGLVVPEDCGDPEQSDFRTLVETLSEAPRLAAMRAAESSSELYRAVLAGNDIADTESDEDGGVVEHAAAGSISG